MANETAVLLIDADAVARERLSQIVAAIPGFRIAGSCASVLEGLVLLRQRTVNLVLLDASHSSGAITFCPRARAVGFRGAVVVLSSEMTVALGAAFVQQGVAAISSPTKTFDDLVEVMQLAVKGVTTIDERYFRAATEQRPASESPEFNDREWQIIYYLMDGLSNKEIAGRIRMSEATVKSTLRKIYDISGVRTRGRLICMLLDREVLKKRPEGVWPAGTHSNCYST